MGQTVELNLTCPSCGGPLTLHAADWGSATVIDTPWTCPACAGPHHIAMAGRLIKVVRRPGGLTIH